MHSLLRIYASTKKHFNISGNDKIKTIKQKITDMNAYLDLNWIPNTLLNSNDSEGRSQSVDSR